MLDIFDGITALFGQQVSIKKSKVMAVDRHRHAVFQVEHEGRTVEAVRDPPRILVRGRGGTRSGG